MKILLLVPFALLLLTFAIELESIAHDTAEKALNYAEDMNYAMDCAVRGIPIKECSPELMNIDFRHEINRTIHVLEEIKHNESAMAVIYINGTAYVPV